MAALHVVDVSSVSEDDYLYHGPVQSLTAISTDSDHFWQSAAGDANPWILFKMLHEHEVIAVDVVDRQDCCFERFQNVEIRVGSTMSFEDAKSCGTQSYGNNGKTTYK